MIVGAGPAGISAALYAVRDNMKPIIINDEASALNKAEKIENYYGLETSISGPELYERGLLQAKSLGVEIVEGQVLGINGYDTFTVQTTVGDYDTLSVVLATGSKRTTPNIAGIKKLEGKGVSYCAICDAFFYRNKTVAVIGNSDFALHEAEILSHAASSVTIYTDGKHPDFSRDHSFKVITDKIQSIEGEAGVTGIKLCHDNTVASGDEKLYLVDGVFVALGSAGSTAIARQMGAELTDRGNIKINAEMESTIPGIFAAGDCTGGLLQVSKAAYEGAVAGLSAVKYVRNKMKQS